MTKLAFAKSEPLAAITNTSSSAVAAVLDGVRYVFFSTEGPSAICYSEDGEQAPAFAFNYDGLSPVFVNNELLFFRYMSVSKFFPGTDEIVEIATLTDDPAIDAVAAFGNITDITYFKGAYRIMFYYSSQAYYVYTYDFETYSAPVFLASSASSRTFSILDDGDTLVLATTRSMHATNNGVSFFATGSHAFSMFSGAIYTLNNVLYTKLRPSLNDEWIYKCDNYVTWTPVYDLPNITCNVLNLGSSLEINNEMYAEEGTDALFYLEIDSTHTVTVRSGPVMASTVPYSNTASVSAVSVNDETWLVPSFTQSVEDGKFLYTPDFGQTWLPFITLPAPERTGAATSALTYSLAYDPISHITHQVRTLDAGVSTYPYSKTFLYVTKDGIEKIRRPSAATKVAGLPNGRLMAFNVYNAKAFVAETLHGSWKTYTALQERLSQNGLLYTNAQLMDVYDTADSVYVLLRFSTTVAVARYDVSKAYANERDAWSVSVVTASASTLKHNLIVTDVSVIFTAYHSLTNEFRIYVSTDKGKTFTQKVSDSASGWISSLDYAAVSGTRVILGYANKAYLSLDNGDTWVRTYPQAKNSPIPVWVFANKSGFIGFDDDQRDFIYSNDGFIWQTGTAADLTAVLNDNDIQAALQVGEFFVLFPYVNAYVPPKVLPDNGTDLYPMYVSATGFWTDFVNCTEV